MGTGSDGWPKNITVMSQLSGVCGRVSTMPRSTTWVGSSRILGGQRRVDVGKVGIHGTVRHRLVLGCRLAVCTGLVSAHWQHWRALVTWSSEHEVVK